MQIIKATILIACLLIVGFLLYIFLPNFNQTKHVSVDTQSTLLKEQIEMKLETTTAEEESQLEEENQIIADENQEIPITEEIKEKVREVLDDVFVLFKKDIKIVSIGDSLTQGVGDETENGGYVGILDHTFQDQHLNITIENFGKKGNRTDQLLKRLEKKEIKSSMKEANIVLITIGANDIMNVVKNNWTNLNMEPFQKERVEYIKRLTSIFTKINEINPDAEIYLIGFYNPFEQYFGEIEQFGMITDNWNEAGMSVTDEFENVNYIPIYDLFTSPNVDLLAEDHFHPNTKGYKLIAKRVLDYLEEFSEETEITNETIE
jgi:lysophospholipase L1-like esterase